MHNEPSQIEAFEEFLGQVREESDRAAVILGASKLDFQLSQLINHFLVANYSKTDELFDGDGPLSTFSARINLSFRLGLIDAQFAKALHLIRRIRNDFAHGIVDTRLDTGPHRDRVRELAAQVSGSPLFSEVKHMYFSDKSGPSADFFAVLTLIAARLEILTFKTTPLTGSSAHSIVPNKHSGRTTAHAKEVNKSRRETGRSSATKDA